MHLNTFHIVVMRLLFSSFSICLFVLYFSLSLCSDCFMFTGLVYNTALVVSVLYTFFLLNSQLFNMESKKQHGNEKIKENKRDGTTTILPCF